MKRRSRVGLVAVGIAFAALSAAARADTIVLKDGRRVDGELVAVRDGIVEFDGHRGFFGGRERMRIDRVDVRRIELDDVERDRRDGSDHGRGQTARRAQLAIVRSAVTVVMHAVVHAWLQVLGGMGRGVHQRPHDNQT